MNRKTRLPKGAGSKKRDRLTHESNDSRKEAAKMLQSVSNERLSRYASRPEFGVVHEEAAKELQKRKELLGFWKKGKPLPAEAGVKKEPLIRRIAGTARKGVQLIGKGLQEYAKLLSGEKARELEESIETAGMKPEDKAAYIKSKREAEAKALAEEEQEMKQYFPMAYPEEEEPAAEKPVSLAKPERPAAPERKEEGRTTINIYPSERKAEREKPPRDEEEHDVEETGVEPEEENAFDIIAEGRRELAKDRADLDEDRAEFASDDFASEIADDVRGLSEDAAELQEDRADIEREREGALQEVHRARSKRK